MMEIELEQAGSSVRWDEETMAIKVISQLEESVRMIIDDDNEGSLHSRESGDTSFSEQTDRELFGSET